MYTKETNTKKNKRPVIGSLQGQNDFFGDNRNMYPPLRQDQPQSEVPFVVDWQIDSGDVPQKP